MAQMESQRKATEKYNKTHYKQLKANLKFADYDLIDHYCRTNGISKASFMVGAMKYCIKNNIDLSKEQE